MESSTGTVSDTQPNNDSLVLTKKYFDNYQKTRINYPSNQVDAVIGFFESKGFEKTAAISVGSVILQQAKIDQISVMELIDKIKTFDSVKLNELVGAILNNNRNKNSILGFRDTEDNSKNIYSRNILT
jgi:hypothetical protein